MAKGEGSKTKKKKGAELKWVGLVIIVLVIGLAVFFYYEYLSGGILSLVYAAGANPSALKGIVLQQLNSNNQLYLSYVGTVTLNETTPQGDPTVVLPFSLRYIKYYNDTRTDLMLKNFPSLGSIGLIVISSDNGTVLACRSFNYSGFDCDQSSGTVQQILANITDQFSFSNIGNITISSILPSYNDSLPCFMVYGRGSTYGRSVLYPNDTSAQFKFDGCFSSRYYVPLNLTVVMTPTGESPITIVLTSVNVSQSTNQSQVMALPKHLANGTQ